MEAQKIVNYLLEKSDDEEISEIATGKWYIINDQNIGQYCEGGENNFTIKFETEVIKPNLCDYLDAYILVTGYVAAQGGNANTEVVFKNCAPFTRCVINMLKLLKI